MAKNDDYVLPAWGPGLSIIPQTTNRAFEQLMPGVSNIQNDQLISYYENDAPKIIDGHDSIKIRPIKDIRVIDTSIFFVTPNKKENAIRREFHLVHPSTELCGIS